MLEFVSKQWANLVLPAGLLQIGKYELLTLGGLVHQTVTPICFHFDRLNGPPRIGYDFKPP